MHKEKRSAWKMAVRAWKIYGRLCPGRFWSAGLYALASAAAPYATVWLTARLVADLSAAREPRRLITDVVLLLAVTAALTLLKAALEHWHTVETEVGQRAAFRVYMEAWLGMDYADVDRQAVYDLYSTCQQNNNFMGWGLTVAMEELEKGLTALVQILGGAALTVGLFTARVPDGPMAVLNRPVFSALLLLCMLGAAMLAPWCDNRANGYVNRYVSEANRGNRYFAFYGLMSRERDRAPDLRMYNQQENVCDVYFSRDDSFTPTSQIARWARGPMGLWRTLSACVSVALMGIVYLFVCGKAWGGAFGLGEVTQYIGVSTTLFLGISELLRVVGELRCNGEFLDQVFRFLDIPRRMYRGSLTTEKRSDRNYTIEFRDVSFRYPGSDSYALRHVNMTFRVGSRLAVVGMNGSGKTTFIKLLCRLYDPTDGEILLNGIDIRKYRYDEYMDIFSVVFQDFQLFALPLGQNVAARREYDPQRAEDCLRKAGFGDRLDRLPHGLETYLYKDLQKDGVEVSGGEAQKIAIARALYKDAPFIILDEPTAALDPVAEAEIYEKFNDIAGDKTAIYISHRLSSCKFCDEIAVFDGGRVVQQGSHRDLLADTGGKYHELWQAQAQYYVKDEA